MSVVGETAVVHSPFRGWAIVELLPGIDLPARTVAGYVEDVEMFGGRLARVDEYKGDTDAPRATTFYGAAAIYSVTPVDSARCREFTTPLALVDRRNVRQPELNDECSCRHFLDDHIDPGGCVVPGCSCQVFDLNDPRS